MSEVVEGKRKSSTKPARQTARVSMTGDFIDQVVKVGASSMSLLVSPGEVEDPPRTVLIPFIAATLIGKSEINAGESQKIFSQTQSIENVALVLAYWARDFDVVLDQLKLMSAGSIKAEQAQIKMTRRYLEAAQEAIADCLVTLDDIET